MAEADPKLSDPAIRVPVGELRANLSRYLKQVEQGANVVVMSRGKPIAELKGVAPTTPAGPRAFGPLKGKMDVLDDFDSWPEGMMDGFEAPL